VSSGEQIWQTSSPVPLTEVDHSHWYAVQTRARHEKVVSERLQEQGLTTFLPLIGEVHRWSDRQKKVELPLFSCYVFVRMVPENNEGRLRVYRVNGVFGIVGVRGEGGSMDGVEGVLVARNGDRTLVVSIDAIQRSLAVRIEGYDVEAV